MLSCEHHTPNSVASNQFSAQLLCLCFYGIRRIAEDDRYWGSSYNWRTGEAKLNALPEFVTTIDGVDIQFIHTRSREPNALPLD